MTPVVRMSGVRRAYAGPPEVTAVARADLEIEPGEYLSIVGPSGSGKSTLLHLLGLLDRPSGGRYELDGEDTATLAERSRSILRAQRIGFVFQAFHLLEHRTVLENVALALVYVGVPRKQRLARAARSLERVRMAHRMQFPPSVLSGGERQRVAVARALVSDPALLLADEPTGNLDSETANALLDVLAGLHADGLTLVVITHDQRVSSRATRTVPIIDGVLG